ncbi:copper resistance protein B [Phenylobacterium kunshanense]|uniref:Copper resistance protein CopB n=1 Tax=Phenylobacterium kunshanense TaxID=1445034 RepID=A0A328B6H7_9CAUL|nr:copper resistance protein B [Phenylobacterium kunshanense]RAK62489.1 copper resistance protein CopB [Phenylobacterium kunshanense]
MTALASPVLALGLLAAAFPEIGEAAAQDPHAHHHAPPAEAPPVEAPKPAATDPHAGHAMPPATAPDPHAGHVMPATPAPDPHAGHRMAPAAPPADPHAGHAMPADPHAGHGAPPTGPVGGEPPPPVPTDHAADQIFSPTAMAAARDQLRREHGEMSWATGMLETAEYRPSGDGDGYAWEGRFSYGGDVNRLVLRSEGEGASGDLESAELQVLGSRAIGPYFNLQAGVRQDVEPRPRRTYATVGLEGLAPYWFEVGAAAFLSEKGDLSARFEASYDLRLTQRLILEPRAEADVAFSDDPAVGVGSGVSKLELGLRLRYAITPEFAPYVGVNWDRKLGDTADLARAAGEHASDTRFVVGLRAWF